MFLFSLDWLRTFRDFLPLAILLPLDQRPQSISLIETAISLALDAAPLGGRLSRPRIEKQTKTNAMEGVAMLTKTTGH